MPKLIYFYYYLVKPLLPRRLQLWLRRSVARLKRPFCEGKWPIDHDAASPPSHWGGWPEGKRFALVLTHDVETGAGQFLCNRVADMEAARGFRSSFNFVPERYQASPELRNSLRKRGFEVGVHGLTHDGKLFFSRRSFRRKAKQINRYLAEWESIGFRAPSMIHDAEWLHELNIRYDLSTFDTDPFEPQSVGVGTIFPFISFEKQGNGSYVEIPYTLPQDSTLFLILREKDISIWKTKLDWIVAHGGMALLNTHPDYMSFDEDTHGHTQYPARLYAEFLDYVRQKYDGIYWHALPEEMMKFTASKESQPWAAMQL